MGQTRLREQDDARGPDVTLIRQMVVIGGITSYGVFTFSNTNRAESKTIRCYAAMRCNGALLFFNGAQLTIR
ncbi:18810_t:CDS:2 [Acaulospora morrowiae]|uniref:18810_t:CDS:1 n=1 Tax=Acaulospora morrowiae TaxID=94023 RepID=A0A9N8W1U8_9GLOM|nr:18810_t:CDS:2 [Acaulospora morrowiae]